MIQQQNKQKYIFLNLCIKHLYLFIKILADVQNILIKMYKSRSKKFEQVETSWR